MSLPADCNIWESKFFNILSPEQVRKCLSYGQKCTFHTLIKKNSPDCSWKVQVDFRQRLPSRTSVHQCVFFCYYLRHIRWNFKACSLSGLDRFFWRIMVMPLSLYRFFVLSDDWGEEPAPTAGRLCQWGQLFQTQSHNKGEFAFLPTSFKFQLWPYEEFLVFSLVLV